MERPLSKKVGKTERSTVHSKKTKAQDISDINASTVLNSGRRKGCNCQATKHPLLSIAPNCLNCGKIICEFEGTGPCTFCETPVYSREQQLQIVHQAKPQGMPAQKQSKRKQKSSYGGSVPYAAKVSGKLFASGSGWVELGKDSETLERERQIKEEKRRAAEKHKEKLLEYDRLGVKRTKIIDQATDFELPSDKPNLWLTTQEKENLARKQQANLRKLETPRSAQRKIVHINLDTRETSVEVVDESEDDVQSETQSEVRMKGQSQEPRTIPRVTQVLEPPTYIGSSSMNKRPDKLNRERKRQSRVQHEMDTFDESATYSTGPEVSLMDGVEPDCG